MNWLHFLLWVGGLYALYYLAVILFDVAGSRRLQAASSGHELTFTEHVEPVQMTAPAAVKHEPEMIASGGVVIDNLFKLCKQEAVVYTRSVSF